MTLQEMRIQAARRLAEEPLLASQAARDTDLLLMFALQVDRTLLFAHPEQPLSPQQTSRVEALIERRFRMEPIQHITGEQEFYGLPFRVTPATLIPRPETELLVDAVLARVAGPAQIVDVGTGSGAIAIALASRLPLARVVGVDLSEAALTIARENASRNQVTVDFRLSDLLAAVPGELDVVVSNPPYIPEGDRPTLHPEVREFEPGTALFAGTDGLNIYRRLIPEARAKLRPGGWLTMEFGFGQAGALRELIRGWDEIEILTDLQGIERVIVAKQAH
ncbi:peptide chain release factor N(5)-glutamine methyltransferase [Granulicella sibirica]|uniref:Release factor glutamine methyltransferase n=1 Tax=Granulicella sibirica TaxID=2479048 RepID=A0A4Q0TA51_9BACT|nr:peptide chain release factor N(5)-glutamine methyltransferase [Granulicella sibirica]RXH58646.1 Protein-N(5)-glutamine methyltransferase PrmC [Granulicella sibirica]